MKAQPIPALRDGATYFTNEHGDRVCTGSQMGRCNLLPDDRAQPIKLRLYRLRFVDGDYDQAGAYWGGPATVWRAVGYDRDGDLVECFVRALDRVDAKSAVRSILPCAAFYR